MASTKAPQEFKDVVVPNGFEGNSCVYYPDGVLFGLGNKQKFHEICQVHDYLYSTLSDEDYPEITKKQADEMLREKLKQEGFPQHAEAYYKVLQDIGHLFYKKKPQGDPKRTHDFEQAMRNIDNTMKFRTIDTILIGGTILLGIYAFTKFNK
mmetsp:Transcript_9610/g.11880  ORF Transcript_9610/g.11880 Transcript_9610/m.11880 type:complete len:152 (-) Transcript_9610:33-488(-)